MRKPRTTSSAPPAAQEAPAVQPLNMIDTKEGLKKTKEKFSDVEIKTFDEKSKEILNYLDSIGENIYDDSRIPNMYIKSARKIPSHIKHVFANEKKQSDNSEEEQAEIQTPNLKQLFNS
jgi:hypothetical protein